MHKFDVIIIGAGSAGLSALREVRKRTDNFVLINDGPWGTTCARVGCMPSKLLIEAANAFHRRFNFGEFGIMGADQLELDGKKVLQRLRRLRDDFVTSTLKITNDLGERAISGRARILSPDQVMVNGEKLSAHKIIIATGSRPVVPKNWLNLGKRLLTTDTLFELDTLPKSIAVIGMGPVGLEMIQALSRLGVHVTGFGFRSSVGGISDPFINQTAVKLLSEEFPLYLGSKASVAINPDNNVLTVRAENIEIEVDSVLAALGRQPNIDDIGLDTLDVPLDEKGLPSVNPITLQIADLPVFLAGDANQRLPLLHEAADDGHIAGLNTTSEELIYFKRRVPLAIVFADPNIAVVGQSFHSLEHENIQIGEVSFSNQGRARSAQSNRGALRVYAAANDGRLLGAEMCAPAGEHFAHLLALAIDQSLSVWDLLRIPFYHPVLEEGLRTALRNLASKLPACSKSDLAACDSFNSEALD
ncbi:MULTISPECIES: dihydrolipoyl dehydrogenase [Nitrosomonas]|uniref:Dihydrolipoamide dehydrogenase n=2 Tax=Nitrosomonas eutropha TaxID=916 RepID=A0ABX5M5X8_9PROT|nr:MULTISPECIES: dihydrolipoyl dehydrogenase [Nitrosomonas]ABI59875.1 pyridine nucleotide-disulfide oxidoreductase dimerization region [Nitrosomonas eutropha C91]MXS80375.1 dihydrolipoyl dehydrogenase [Nitrosomonas sp. GH22]PXV80123.1 dihydrolipoamide dehydrogenase [Nitrosomonas eutropha]SDW76559.1 dihydrolipoamide dehydrogenase [Nitrosomonas eutropha]SEI93257.1 dihydrolipoamide dehydrogenase [Nitrosomonas eutropha]